MNDFAARFGRWAVVTGAASGIGEAFARQLDAKGSRWLTALIEAPS
jgi:short-subunit dehydrogenase